MNKQISVIIVDDEPMARAYIKENFLWDEWGYVLVGEAENGQQALELCERVEPDIALIDITMPVMNGLELLAKLQQDFPQTRCIIISAHRDFEYAQRAIQLNAFGYILKSPINISETKSVLDKIRDDLDQKKMFQQTEKTLQSVIRSYQYPLRQQWFKERLASSFTDNPELTERGHAIGMNLSATVYLLLIGQVDKLFDYRKRYPEKDHALIEYCMLEIVRETCQTVFPGQFELIPIHFGQFAIILMDRSADNWSGPDYPASVHMLDQQLRTPLEQYMNIRIVLTASRPLDRLNRLRQEFAACVALLSDRFYQQHPQPIFTERRLAYQQMNKDDLVKLEAGFIQHIANGAASDEMERWLSRVKEYMLRNRPDPQVVTNWFSSLKDNPDLQTDAAAFPVWPNFERCASLFEALDELMMWYSELDRKRKQTIAIRPEVAHAIQYIKSNLAKELSLDQIALEVQLSSSYLGVIFKKEMGMSVFDYIIKLRIELAKKFLSTGQYKNYELADKSGFTSYSYFCTMFKRYTGMTPNEYRLSTKTLVISDNEAD